MRCPLGSATTLLPHCQGSACTHLWSPGQVIAIRVGAAAVSKVLHRQLIGQAVRSIVSWQL
jgi:hypothetical protein